MAYEKIVRNRSGCSQENSCERKKKFYGVQVGFHRSYLPYRNTIFLAFIVLEILTGHKQKIVCNFSACSQEKSSERKKNNRGVEVCFHYFSCVVLQWSVLLLSRARNGHGRAHWSDDIGDFGEIIRNFLPYRKVKLVFLFILSSVAHSHVLKVFRKIICLDHLLPMNLKTQHQF